jgi:hypothetical protein
VINESPALTVVVGWLVMLGAPLYLAGAFVAGRWQAGVRWRLLIAAGLAVAVFGMGIAIIVPIPAIVLLDSEFCSTLSGELLPTLGLGLICFSLGILVLVYALLSLGAWTQRRMASS